MGYSRNCIKCHKIKKSIWFDGNTNKCIPCTKKQLNTNKCTRSTRIKANNIRTTGKRINVSLPANLPVKYCYTCDKWKDRELFGKDKSKHDGLSNMCKADKTLRDKQRYVLKGGFIRARANQWSKDNPERKAINQRRYYKNNARLINERSRNRYKDKKLIKA